MSSRPYWGQFCGNVLDLGVLLRPYRNVCIFAAAERAWRIVPLLRFLFSSHFADSKGEKGLVLLLTDRLSDEERDVLRIDLPNAHFLTSRNKSLGVRKWVHMRQRLLLQRRKNETSKPSFVIALCEDPTSKPEERWRKSLLDRLSSLDAFLIKVCLWDKSLGSSGGRGFCRREGSARLWPSLDPVFDCAFRDWPPLLKGETDWRQPAFCGCDLTPAWRFQVGDELYEFDLDVVSNRMLFRKVFLMGTKSPDSPIYRIPNELLCMIYEYL